MKLTLEISFAEKCAWRCVYIYVNGRQIARLGIDPTFDDGPRLIIGLGRFGGSYRLPVMRYRPQMGRLASAIYQRQQAFLYSIDGRKAS